VPTNAPGKRIDASVPATACEGLDGCLRKSGRENASALSVGRAISDFADIEERVRKANTAFAQLRPGEGGRFAAWIDVEVRCRAKGHFLAAVYSTREGALFVSSTEHVPKRDELSRKQGRRRRAWTPTVDVIDFLPDEDDVHPDLIVRCRCGTHDPVARREVLKALAKARQTRTVEQLFV
jgi:hypothetical protein